MTDKISTKSSVLTAFMPEIIFKPLRTFILVPNGIIKQTRIPMVTFKRQNICSVMPDLHREACLQNSCWGSQQEQLSLKPELQHLFLDATSNPEDISSADNALLPLIEDLDTLLYTYGEPVHDESTTDCMKMH